MGQEPVNAPPALNAIEMMVNLGFTKEEMDVVRGSISPDIAPLLNEEHLKILLWCIRGRGNGAVNARAGSGKTWLGVNGVVPVWEYLGTEKIGYLCFAKRNQLELASKLKDLNSIAQAKTIDSLSWVACKRKYGNEMAKDGDENKYNKLVRDCIKNLDQLGASNKLIAAVENEEVELYLPAVKLINFTRSQLADPTDERLESLANWFDIELPGDDEADRICFEIVRKCLAAGYEQAPYIWDFQDLRWKTCKAGLFVQQFDKLVVDECQDLSPDKLRIVQQALKKGGRVLFIGDPEQAIMGFAGADHQSFENIVEKFDCDLMTLSVCWRCGSKILDMARTVVPDIRDAPGAIEGVIDELKLDKLIGSAKEGDMVLCRVNADLISLCFGMIAAGVNARVIGRDIGKGLIQTATYLSKQRSFSWLRFDDAVQEWKADRIAKVLKKNGGDHDDVRIQNIADKAMCLNIIWDRSKARTLKQFEREVNSIFSDSRPGVALSSVHRAKGLEADRVFILRPELLPGPWARKGSWQHKQELNLHYVALTRSRSHLTFIR